MLQFTVIFLPYSLSLLPPAYSFLLLFIYSICYFPIALTLSLSHPALTRVTPSTSPYCTFSHHPYTLPHPPTHPLSVQGLSGHNSTETTNITVIPHNAGQTHPSHAPSTPHNQPIHSIPMLDLPYCTPVAKVTVPLYTMRVLHGVPWGFRGAMSNVLTKGEWKNDRTLHQWRQTVRGRACGES